MTSIYLATFAAAQLPGGVALDRFGPRRVGPVPRSAPVVTAALLVLQVAAWAWYAASRAARDLA